MTNMEAEAAKVREVIAEVHKAGNDLVWNLENYTKAGGDPDEIVQSLESFIRAVVRDCLVRLEYTAVTKDAGYTNCDICDQRQGTHEIAYGGVRCDECREKAEATPRRIASVDSAGYATFEHDPNYSGKAEGKSHE